MTSRVTNLLIDKEDIQILSILSMMNMNIIQPNILVFLIICHFVGFLLYWQPDLTNSKNPLDSKFSMKILYWAVGAGIRWRALRTAECQVWAGAEEAGAREWEAPMSGSQLGPGLTERTLRQWGQTSDNKSTCSKLWPLSTAQKDAMIFWWLRVCMMTWRLCGLASLKHKKSSVLVLWESRLCLIGVWVCD